MIIDANWTPPPMVKDLPRDGRIEIRCKTCDRGWSQPVIDLIDRRMGAMFVDLLEMQTRCQDQGCRKAVRFTCIGEAARTTPAKSASHRPMPPRIVKAKPLLQVDLFGMNMASTRHNTATRPFESHA